MVGVRARSVPLLALARRRAPGVRYPLRPVRDLLSDLWTAVLVSSSRRRFVVPRQHRVDAARRKTIELFLAELAQLRGVAAVAEIRTEHCDCEALEPIADRRIDHRVGRRFECVEAVEPV